MHKKERGRIRHFKWFFSLAAGVSAERASKLMATVLRRYAWSPGVVVCGTSMYSDETFRYTQIKL